MANFTTKTIKEVFDSFIAKYTVIRSNYGDESPLLEKSLIKSIGYAIAGEAGTLWQLSVWIYKQCFPQTADLPALKLWGNLVGIDYKFGTSTNLTIELNDVTAGFLSSGTVYKNLTTGLIFKTVSQSANESGKVTATVACSTGGTVGNLPVGTVLNIANPTNGIPSTATIIGIKIEGTNDEEVETYRKRVLARYKSRSQGGSMLDYYNWGMEVPGIEDVIPYIIEEGVVSLYLVSEGSAKNRNVSGSLSPNPFPVWKDGEFQKFTGTGKLLQVAYSIEGDKVGEHNRRPMCARVKLLNPTYTEYSVTIEGLSDISFNETIKDALITEFDKKRPSSAVLNYTNSKTKINRESLSSIVSNIIGEDKSFKSLKLKNAKNEEIDEDVLKVGCLAVMSNLTINGSKIEV